MLVGHWPLIGNTNDYSGFNNNGTPTSITYTAGKIGQAASFNGSTSSILTPLTTQNLTRMSLSFWIYNTASGAAGLIGTISGGRSLSVFRYPNLDDFHWSTVGSSGVDSDVLPFSTWTHVCLTYNGSLIKRYYNGVFFGQTSGTIAQNTAPIYIGRNDSGYSNILLNDVRIYDHALSDYEVKELTKANIVHYTFDNPEEEPTVNLATPIFNFSGMGYGLTYTYSGIDSEGWHRWSISGTGTSNTYPYTINITPSNILLSTRTSFSFKYKTNVNNKYVDGFRDPRMVNITYAAGFNSSDIDRGAYREAKIQNVSPASGAESQSQPIYFLSRPQNGVTFNPATDFVYFKDVQAERKLYATPFTIGTRNIGVADSSGLKTNGNVSEISTSPRWVSDSKIGSGSIYFNGTNPNIQIPITSFVGLTTVTISFWRKNDTIITNWLPFSGQTNSFYIMATSSGTGGFYHNGIGSSWEIFKDGVGQGIGVAATPFTDQNWHHYAIRNVTLETWTILKLNGYTGVWNNEGYFDDVRIYNTNLSNADILALYNRRANLDNQGNVQVDEIITSNMIPVSEGLKLHLNPNHISSYPGTGTSFKDLTDNRKHFLLDASGIVHNSNGYFVLNDGGMIISPASAITTSSTATVVFWIKTTDTQALFLEGNTTSFWVGAYSASNKYYNSNSGSPSLFIDTVSRANLFDFLLDNKYHMVEFKGANLSTWTNFKINKYPNFTFGGNTELGEVMIFDRIITSEESAALYNYFINGNRDFKHQRGNFNALGQAIYTDIDEVTGTQNTGAQQEIKDNGTLVINGEFSEVD